MTMQSLGNAEYTSVAAFVVAATTECRNPGSLQTRDEMLTRDRGDWFGAGCRTGQDVQRFLHEGWTEGRTRVDAFLTKLETIELTPRDMRRRLARADMGDHLDIGAVYAGRFDTAWTVARRRSSIGPQRVDVLANMICHGGENADVLFWRGAAAVSLCDKLEAAGYMVRLAVGFGGINSSTCERVSCRVEIKRHDMPMDIATASSVILPGFFRCIGHAWTAGHTVAACHSCSMSVNECLQEKGEVFLTHKVRDETTARAWVEAQIKALDTPQDLAA